MTRRAWLLLWRDRTVLVLLFVWCFFVFAGPVYRREGKGGQRINHRRTELAKPGRFRLLVYRRMCLVVHVQVHVRLHACLLCCACACA